VLEPAALWTFVVVVGLLTLTPGLDTALIVRTASLHGAGRAWGVVAGIQTGTLIWGALSGAGVTVVLMASQVAYEVLRWAGVCYLAWLGLRMLRDSFRQLPADPAGQSPAAFLAGWRRGVLTNLLNPKAGAFSMALLPQLLPAGAAPLAFGIGLAALHVALGTVWATVLVALARRMRALLRTPVARRWMDRVTGTVIVGFGVRLALSAR
jgi:threonine/homoserine/homoserine lactone efflux protein